MSKVEQIILEKQQPQSLEVTARAATEQACTFPLSLMQESLWFFDQMMPGSGAYNIPEAWRLQGPLDLEALRATLPELTERHESLRTVFRARDGKPEQIVLPTGAVDFAVTDLSRRDDSEAELARLFEERTHSQPMDEAVVGPPRKRPRRKAE